MASGFGSVFGDLRRAHGGERADLALAVAFEEARERAHAREHAHQRAAADAVGAPRRHEGAHVRRRQRRELASVGCTAEMLGQEAGTADVALVGLDRLRRHPPLGAEDSRASARPRPRRRRPHKRHRCMFGAVHGRDNGVITAFLHPSLSARNRASIGPHGPALRRCSGAGRARPGLFLPGAAGHGAGARRRRGGAARRARGAGRGVGGERAIPSPACTTASRTSRTSSTCRR